MYAEAGAFAPGRIKPILKVGENLMLFDGQYKLYGVSYIEPLPYSFPLVFNAGAIAAGVTASNQNTQLITDNPYGVLTQMRFRVLDDIAVTLRQPQSVARDGNLNQTARITAFTALFDQDDAMSETFIFENNRVFFDVLNPTQYTLAQARVLFYGLKYILVGSGQRAGTSAAGHLPPLRGPWSSIEAAQKEIPHFTVVPVGGWAQ